MMDIFSEKDQPKLFIADITVKFALKGKGIIKFGRTQEVFMTNKIIKYPLLLINDNGSYKTPSSKYNNSLIGRLESYISVGFKPGTVSIHEIKNVNYSSDICYKFDY